MQCRDHSTRGGKHCGAVYYIAYTLQRYIVHLCTLTFALSAASPFSVSRFLETYEDEFLEVVNPKLRLRKLIHERVISSDVRTAIESANDEDAKYILFEHLQKNATVDTLRVYCDVAIAANGFPRWQELGKKMMDALPPGGWSELNSLCVCVCVFMRSCERMCVSVCARCVQSMQAYILCSFVCGFGIWCVLYVYICRIHIIPLTFLRKVNMPDICHYWTQLVVTTGQI